MTTACPVRLARNGVYWVARWRTTDGEPRARSLGKCSKREAERKCWEIAAEFALEPGKRDAHKAPTLGEWAERYPKLRDDLNERTIMLHRKTLEYLKARHGAGLRLDKFTPAKADDWRVWLGKQKGPNGTLSAQTVAAHIRNAKVIFERARRRRLIGSNPFADISGQAPKVSKDWREVTPADLDRILDACPSAEWRVLFALCRLAGLRRGEAIALRWGDIDWQARRLRADGKTGPRLVPVSPALLEILQAAYDEAQPGAELVCGQLRYADLHRGATAIVKRSGVGRYSKPFHTMRKCLESEWVKIAPWPTVCSWLGHSAKVAAEHYLRPGEDDFARVTGQEKQDGHVHRAGPGSEVQAGRA